MHFMNSWYWKALGVILILLSIIIGLLVPLKPGIIGIDRLSAKEGSDLNLKIETYNFNPTEVTTGFNAYLKVDSPLQIIKSSNVSFITKDLYSAEFFIPAIDFMDKEVVEADVIITREQGGYAYLPGGLFIRNVQDLAIENRGEELDNSIAVEELSGIYFPFRNILLETIKNTYYHIPLWFAMIIMFGLSAWYSSKYLRNKDITNDLRSQAFSEVGLLLGILGLVTGAIWAKFTWGAFWSWDIKQFTSAVALLIYLAYFILRSSARDLTQRARLTAAYNIFAFIMLIPLLFIIPRMTDSLHPGNGGNPAMGGEDLDNTMRMIFYPAIIGWILFSNWISDIRFRILNLKYKFLLSVGS